MKKIAAIFIILAVAAVFGLVIFSLWDTQMLPKAVKKISPQKIQRLEPVKPAARELLPQRPEDYGMIVTDENTMPVGQKQYDAFIKDKISKLKSEYPLETWNKVQEKIKEDPAVTRQKISQIDEAIEKCRRLLEKEPENIEVRQKMERLMMLRSIGESLPSPR